MRGGKRQGAGKKPMKLLPIAKQTKPYTFRFKNETIKKFGGIKNLRKEIYNKFN